MAGENNSGSSTASSWMRAGDDIGSMHQLHFESGRLDPKTRYHDIIKGTPTIEDVMHEFHLNGFDSPYNPDEDQIWTRRTGELSGMGPAGEYLRQKSWPELESSKPQKLTRPRTMYEPHWPTAELATSTSVYSGELSGMGPAGAYLRQKSWPEPSSSQTLTRPHSMYEPHWPTAEFATSTPLLDEAPAAPFVPEVERVPDALTEEQWRVLRSIPEDLLYTLFPLMRQGRRNKPPQECGFCKNNGERESYYRSHVLRDARGRVSCPVLRAYVCRRCGASGDRAHTIKYCPSSTSEERIMSAAMMRSIRMASGRRRNTTAPSLAVPGNYVVFGSPSPPFECDTNNKYEEYPLDPRWATVVEKLLRHS